MTTPGTSAEPASAGGWDPVRGDQAPLDPAGPVRVTVVGGGRRVDLALPGSVPVVELVPEVLGHLGLLDAGTAHTGHRLATTDSRVLAGNAGLVDQGVDDGALLVVTTELDGVGPRVHDDVAEALADAVRERSAPWQRADSRRGALTVATILLGLGAAALLLHGGRAMGVLAAGGAVVLLAGSVLRARAGVDDAGVVALLATPLAAVAGLLLVPGEWPGWRWPPRDAFFAAPVAGAGAGLLLVGLVGMTGLRGSRGATLPALVLGLVLVPGGATMLLVRPEPALVWVTTTTLLVLTGSVLPWLALGLAGTRVELVPDPTDPDGSTDPGDQDGPDGPVDAGWVATEARRAQAVMRGVSIVVGVVVVLVAPLAVDRGVSGTALAVVWCVVVLLRARRHHARAEVLTGLVSGVLGLVSVTVAVLATRPEWRAGTGLVLLAVGAGALVVALHGPRPSPRRAWLAEVGETVALLALLPLMVVANGALGGVLG